MKKVMIVMVILMRLLTGCRVHDNARYKSIATIGKMTNTEVVTYWDDNVKTYENSTKLGKEIMLLQRSLKRIGSKTPFPFIFSRRSISMKILFVILILLSFIFGMLCMKLIQKRKYIGTLIIFQGRGQELPCLEMANDQVIHTLTDRDKIEMDVRIIQNV